MRKKIGQIDIFASDEPNFIGSSYSTKADYAAKHRPEYRGHLHSTGPEHYIIELNPRSDVNTMRTLYGEKGARLGADVRTIFAHELGHIVAEMTGDPAHVEKVFFSRNAREKKAWEIAEEITPVSKEHRELALKSYEGMG